MKWALIFLVFNCWLVQKVHARTILTNAVRMHNAPAWLNHVRIDQVVNHIELHLEWSIHRIDAYMYSSETEYDNAQSFGPLSLAVTETGDNKAIVRLSPRVNKDNFDQVFGHELVHVIVFQKYRGAVPKWLEEGLANFYSRTDCIDYKWLAKQPFPKDVRQLTHPMHGTLARIDYRYKASEAFAEMLHHNCNLTELLRLSVTRKMTPYIHSYCGIKDLNAAFRAWVKTQATHSTCVPDHWDKIY